jgi:TetR/AcrR family transcriptional regulator, fatty acid metabolism regulator protein
METEKRPTGQKLSFIERARRAQIVEAAIETFASAGYARASLARIAKRAGISKSVISYHFRGKDELVREVIKEAIAKANGVMLPRISAQRSYAAALRAYIESNLAFMAAYPNHVVALLNISTAAYMGRREDPNAAVGIAHAVGELEELLRRGQRAGEFRDFAPRAMAVTIRHAIDAVPLMLATDHKLDIEEYGRELATTFDLATRKLRQEA